MDEKTRVLIVDDEPINLDFFDVMLSKLGFEVARADDGEEALEQVKSFSPDLIILDNVMPKMSGWQVTRIIKQDPLYEKYHDIPIIMFSAMDDVKDKIEGFELGVEDYITKPFNFSEVLARIRAVLRGKELYRRVLYREQEMMTAAELQRQFSDFADQIKSPLQDILGGAEKVDCGSESSAREFTETVRRDLGMIVDALSDLETELAERRSGEIERETSLREIDSRFDSHFRMLKENADSMGEVRE
jgi:CheY-like chemotaxis protein